MYSPTQGTKTLYSQQIGQYLAWSIPRTNRFKFDQIKSLGSKMATPKGTFLAHLAKGLESLCHGAAFNQTWQETSLVDGD